MKNPVLEVAARGAVGIVALVTILLVGSGLRGRGAAPRVSRSEVGSIRVTVPRTITLAP